MEQVLSMIYKRLTICYKQGAMVFKVGWGVLLMGLGFAVVTGGCSFVNNSHIPTGLLRLCGPV